MGSFTIRPYADHPSTRGAWVATGAGSVAAAVSDQSDSSYASLSTPYTGGGIYGASLHMKCDSQSLPNGARVRSAQGYIRSADSGGTVRYPWMRIHDNRYYPTPTWLTATNFQIAGSTITNAFGQGEDHLRSGGMDQSMMNNMLIEVFNFSETTVRIYEMGIKVTYDEKPTATITTPTGVVDTTASPVIGWDYNDDFEPQVAYQVQVYSGSNLIYDSGVKNWAFNWHELPIQLAAGTYTAKVRVRQNWHPFYAGYTEFWSDWTSQTFSIATQAPPAPSILVTDQSSQGRAQVSLLSNLNLLSYPAASFETGTSVAPPSGGWFEGWVSVSNATMMATGGALPRSGGECMKFNSASTTAEIASEYIEVNRLNEYTFTIYMRPASGTAMGTFRLRVSEFEADFTTAHGTINGGSNTPSGSAYQKFTMTVAAGTFNALTKRVRFHVEWTAGANTTHVLIDDAYVHMTKAGYAAADESVNRLRGGLAWVSRNLLRQRWADIEDSYHNWTPADGGTVSCNFDTAQARQGSASLKCTKSGSSGDINARLKDNYFDCVAGEIYSFAASIYSPVSSRTVRTVMKFYDAGLSVVATTTVTSTSSSVGAWKDLTGTVTVPANAVFMQPNLQVVSAAANEVQHWDRMDVHLRAGTNDIVWEPGPAGNDSGSKLVLEYSEDAGATWKTLALLDNSAVGDEVTLYDYDVRHGVARHYRAWSWRTQDGVTSVSNYSATAGPITATLQHVWMHATNDPSGTARQFVYIGDDRTDSIDARPEQMDFAGREFPMVEFGETSRRVLACSFELVTTADQQAAYALSALKSGVTFRDQRGRRVRGHIASAQFTDQVWGQVWAFNMHADGDQ